VKLDQVYVATRSMHCGAQ